MFELKKWEVESIMKKMLVLVIIGLLVSVFPVNGADAPVLQDISKHWAKAQIELAVTKGYVSGYPDGSFRPDKQVTRAEFIKMLVAALKLPHSQGGEPWYQPYVAASLESGIHREKDFNKKLAQQ
jgi:hypothetical protein